MIIHGCEPSEIGERVTGKLADADRIYHDMTWLVLAPATFDDYVAQVNEFGVKYSVSCYQCGRATREHFFYRISTD